MVYIPHVVAQEAADAQDQFPVYDLATGKEAFYDMFRDDFAFWLPDREMFDQTVEEPPVLENAFHGIYLRPREYEGACGGVRRLVFADYILHSFPHPFPVFGLVEILEFVEDHDDMLSGFAAYEIGEEEHSFKVVVIRIPVQGNDLVMVGEGETVEDEMRASQMV